MNRPQTGAVQTLAEGLRRLLAPNPGPMTHWGTNTFILGEGDVAVIDPGPNLESHLDALLTATKGETVSHILVTHAHADHSPLARTLSERTGAPVLGFGPAEAGRSNVMTRLANQGLVGGGEGVDKTFAPDECLSDGDRIDGAGWSIDVLHTPGHFSGHLAYAFESGMISGDHVMDWSSSLVSPPDGDLTAFMSTSEKLRDIGTQQLFPGHGQTIADPADRLGWLIEHRRKREADILNALSRAPQSLAKVTARAYTDIPTEMLPAAERNVFAHLIDLSGRNLVTAVPQLGVDAYFSLV